MPYIKQEDRDSFDIPTTPGDLNFHITQMCNLYLQEKGVNYSNLNEVVGALECAKLELYRRVIAPYEDIKMEENGDVYTV